MTIIYYNENSQGSGGGKFVVLVPWFLMCSAPRCWRGDMRTPGESKEMEHFGPSFVCVHQLTSREKKNTSSYSGVNK